MDKFKTKLKRDFQAAKQQSVPTAKPKK